ncbi:MAG: RDD family protein [Chloroflexota bacterium]
MPGQVNRDYSVLKRIQAFALDYLIIVGYLILLTIISTLLVYGPLQEDWEQVISTPIRMDVLAFVTAILPVILYFTFFEGSERGGTWGKQRMNLQVVDMRGEQLGRRRAFVRAIIKFLPWQLAHTCLFHIPGWPIAPQEPPTWVFIGLILVWVLVGAYIVAMVISPRHRTPYDWLAGSQVVVRLNTH